jgi:hypothetical protein
MNAQIHRYGDKVAVYLGTGETAYLCEEDAIRVCVAMTECVESIRKQPSFAKSTFATQSIPLKSIEKNI